MTGVRRFARYPVNLRLRLRLPSGEVETTTEDVSLGGFSAPCVAAIEVGTPLEFVLHLPDETQVDGLASAARFSPDGIAGFTCEFNPVRAADWEAFIAQEQANGGVWRMISRYVTAGGPQKGDARSVLHQGQLPGALGTEAAVLRLHMVGENGEAYRLAFAKQPSHKPEASPFAQASPKILDLTRRAAARVLGEDVILKRTPGAPVFHARLVEMLRGGYAYVHVLASGQPSLMGLQGSELIAIEADGQPVFPFFDEDDLDRIAHDTFRRDPLVERKPSTPAAVLSEERFSARYAHKTVNSRNSDQVTLDELQAAMAAAERVQTRQYAGRTVSLFPELWLEVSRVKAWSAPVRGFAMDDGTATCVFVMAGPQAPCVIRLEPGDELVILRG